MPLALARKYRPKSFAAVAVQSHVSTTLKGAIAHDRVAHGYLLCGPRGTGKTTLARVLAMALNCERRSEHSDGEPCGECASCRRIWSGAASLDVVEIDAASNRGIDDARELRERAMYAPSTADRYKVYIVDEAHMLTREAWNVLLKVLEEPPPRVVFVFATTDPQKIAQSAAPVLSRLQRFDLRRIGAADLRQRLRTVLAEEGVAADDDALVMLARAADGSMRDVLSLADQVLALGDVTTVTVDRVRDALGIIPEDECVAVLDLVAERRAGEIFGAVTRLADAGVDLGAFLNVFADLLRAQLALLLGTETPDLSDRTRAALRAHRESWSPADVLRMLAAVTDLEPRFRKSGQQQLLVETLLVRCALLDRSVLLEDVLRSLSGKGGGGGPHLSAPASVPTGTRTDVPNGPLAPRAVSSPSDGPTGGSSSVPSATTIPPTAPPAVRPGAAPSPAAGDLVAGSPGLAMIDRGALLTRWPDIVTAVRRDRQAPVLAAALAQSTPEPGPEPGVVTLRLAERNAIVTRSITAGESDILAALRTVWPEVERIRVAEPEEPAPGGPRRLTVEAARAGDIAALRKHDAVLGAAIDALDLELIE